MEATAETLEQLSLPVLIGEGRLELVESVVAVERMMSSLAAARAELVDRVREWSETAAGTGPGQDGWSPATVARRELVSELAAALRMPERSVENLIAESAALQHDFPETRAALQSGTITYRHATVMLDHAWSLPDEARADFEQLALPFAEKLTVAKFDRRARTLREAMQPESIEARTTAATAERSVECIPERDGMATLVAYLPAEQALAIYNRVTDLARGLQGPDEDRTLTQLRADVFSDLLIGGETGALRGVRATVLVTVPVLTLLGATEEPATLEGYGPIDAETARWLAARAPSFMRLLTHPETGAVLSLGRTRYAVPKDLRTWLRVRDGTCRFPGCSRAASSCEVDHTDDWQHGGHTRHDNLAHLCKSHHNLKHHTRWKVEQRGGGVLEWTSPLGRKYTVDPETEIRAS
jgi:hypothetical protein